MHYRSSIIWQKSLELAEQACRIADSLPRAERFTLRPQITRAATSVACNVAEGWARESRREKAQFLSIAQGSLAELETQIALCRRLGWIDARRAGEFHAVADHVGRVLTLLRRRFRATATTTSDFRSTIS